MTNLEIYRELASRNKTPRIRKFINLVSLSPFDSELLELVRADEREKMQGVDVWVTRDMDSRDGNTSMWAIDNKPKHDTDIDYWFGKNRVDFRRSSGIKFNISPGQCKKFRIVECEL